MAQLSKAVIIECPARTASVKLFWSLITITTFILSWLTWGVGVALILTLLPLAFWVRYELKPTEKKDSGMVIGWWRSQLHLYEHGIVKVSIPISSIMNVAWFPRRHSLRGSFGTIVVSSKFGVYVSPVGPLPVHVVKRLKILIDSVRNMLDRPEPIPAELVFDD